MMYSYPFFSFPHFGKYTHYYPSRTPLVRQPTKSELYRPSTPYSRATSKSPHLRREPNCEAPKNDVKEKSSPKKAPTGFSFLNNFLHQEDRGEDEEFFNLFGLKLYHDDILLMGLIFFLYQEDVKDQYLFFALILLLLS